VICYGACQKLQETGCCSNGLVRAVTLRRCVGSDGVTSANPTHPQAAAGAPVAIAKSRVVDRGIMYMVVAVSRLSRLLKPSPRRRLYLYGSGMVVTCV